MYQKWWSEEEEEFALNYMKKPRKRIRKSQRTLSLDSVIGYNAWQWKTLLITISLNRNELTLMMNRTSNLKEESQLQTSLESCAHIK